MTRKYWLLAGALLTLLAAAGSSPQLIDRAFAQSAASEPVPIFAVDTSWPQLPGNMVLGVTSKVAVDKHDNVWIIHRPRTVPAGKISAPPVVELGPDGKYIRGWGDENPPPMTGRMPNITSMWTRTTMSISAAQAPAASPRRCAQTT